MSDNILYINDLPEELICVEIASFLKDEDYINLILSNKSFYRNSYKRDIHKEILMSKYMNISDNVKSIINFKNINYDILHNGNIRPLPYGLTHLTLGPYFNQTVDKLPDSITDLTLKMGFNQTLDNLPDSIILHFVE